MLLDRKKVKFWQRIVFGAMAVLMAGFLVFGYSGALSSCQSGGVGTSTDDLDEEISILEQRLQVDETDTVAWGELGDALMSRGSAQQEAAAQQEDWRRAVIAYERKVSLLEGEEGADAKSERRATLETLAGVYDVQLQDYEMAINVYGQLTSLAPKRSEYFLAMGMLAVSAGDTERALLAFSRYLQLAPDSPDAEFVKEWIAANSPDSQGSTP